MMDTVTDTQRAAAEAHFARRHLWIYHVNPRDGRQWISMPSSDGKVRHRVDLAGHSCDCRGSQYRSSCSHRRAAALDAERRAIIEKQHQAAMLAWIAETEERL